MGKRERGIIMARILVFDPSGNWKEGNGTTGYLFGDEKGTIFHIETLIAHDSSQPESYWDKHLLLIDQADEVVMEGFRLYGHKKNEQVNSQFETPQLIGLIRHYCWMQGKELTIPYAVEVKTRWSDEVLASQGIIEKKNGRRYWNKKLLNNHKVDVIRHYQHYIRYTRGKVGKT